MTIQPFEVNGWTIQPSDTDPHLFTVSFTESYTRPSLTAAVRTAQSNTPRTLLKGSPERIDAHLQEVMSSGDRLAFYQWIGEHAVREAVEVAKSNVGEDPAPPQHRSYSQDSVYEFFDLVHPDKDGGPFPSKLPSS